MSFGDSVRYCLNNYANFNGRASRPQFWWFWLFTFIVSAIPSIIGQIFIVAGRPPTPFDDGIVLFSIIGWLLYIVGVIISLAFIVPLLAAGSRRLHDRGLSGWLQLLLLLSFCFGIGFIILAIFWALPGTPGPNQYGESAA